MSNEEMKNLREGSIIQNRGSGLGYIVAGNYGDHLIAIRVLTVTNPDEWNLIRKIA